MNRLRRQMGGIAGTLFANWLASFFYVLFHTLYDIRLSGLENYSVSPSTLVTINHKRDLDIPVVASILHLRKTLFRNGLRWHFVARDDLFAGGFLSAHFSMPEPVGRLAHRTNIGIIMRALQAHPISHLVHKRVGPLMRDVIRVAGDMKLEEAVGGAHLEEFARMLNMSGAGFSDLSVSDFLGYEYCSIHQRETDAGILQDGLARKVRRHALAVIGEQLRVFAGILDEGRICMLAPEGHLSPDGRFWPVKSGLYRLLAMTEADVRVLPVNTVYDFMTRGRMRIYVSVGKEIVGVKGVPRVELERRVQKAIVGLGPVTLGQLASECLMRKLHAGSDSISREELGDTVSGSVPSIKGRGLRVDERLLEEPSFSRRLSDFIGYCLAEGILRKNGKDTYVIVRDRVLGADGGRHRENPVRYSYNEMRSLREIFSVS